MDDNMTEIEDMNRAQLLGHIMRLNKQISRAETLPQSQEPLNTQLCKLQSIANQHGLYDAADFINKVLTK